ncbi:MAG: hypothetical protein RMZ41_023275 [Nostoc sp. DedVER02]
MALTVSKVDGEAMSPTGYAYTSNVMIINALIKLTPNNKLSWHKLNLQVRRRLIASVELLGAVPKPNRRCTNFHKDNRSD